MKREWAHRFICSPSSPREWQQQRQKFGSQHHSPSSPSQRCPALLAAKACACRLVSWSRRLMKTKALEIKTFLSHTICTLRYAAALMFLPACGGCLGRGMSSWQWAEGASRRSKDHFFLQFSCQVHIKLWAHCTLMLVALILKIDLHRHLFGLIYILLFSHKLPEYLRIKICSNTDIHWNSLVQHCVYTLFP